MWTLILFSLVTISLSSPLHNSKFLIGSTKTQAEGKAAYSYAVDVASSIPSSAFSCMKSSGYQTAFVRAYSPDGYGTVDPNAVNNVKNAGYANMGVELYAVPQPQSTKTPATQFDEMLTAMRHGGIDVQAVWLQVSQPIMWANDQYTNINFIIAYLNYAKEYGLNVGIYTNWYDWQQITGNYNVQSLGNVRLVYWNAYGTGVTAASSLDFNDYRTFAGFPYPMAKEYSLQANVCGYTVNQMTYPSSAYKLSAVQNQTKKGKITVGLLGL